MYDLALLVWLMLVCRENGGGSFQNGDKGGGPFENREKGGGPFKKREKGGDPFQNGEKGCEADPLRIERKEVRQTL